MKKVIVFCLALVLVMSSSIVALAASDNFVSSPPSFTGPEVDSFEPSDEDCTGDIVVTPFGDINNLSPELKALMEKAYNDILGAKDLTELCKEFAEYVKGLGIPGTRLAVSDLFDIHVVGCDFHEGHVDFNIVLKAETLKNFVGLLHMNKDGEWEMIKDAVVLADGIHLKFSVESFSPFAIVVDTSGGQTGDNSMIALYAIIMAASALALAVIFVKTRKQKTVD